MSINAPSYLTIRNGIYYFQTRIPASFVQDEGIKRKHRLFRRSTRTGNRREALRIARTWMVELMGNERSMTFEEQVDEGERLSDLYRR